MTLAITPDPQSARATFRERTCAIARAPDDAALHLARLHAALQLPGAEPVQGALADLFAATPLTDPSLRRNALQMAEARLNPHVASGYNYDNLAAFVERSLQNLEMDALDLVQLHCPPTGVYRSHVAFDALERLQAESKIRHYGVSVETVEEALLAIERPNVKTVQIIFNMFRQKPADLFFTTAKAHHVGILARVPLASGLLTGKITRETTFAPDDHRNFNRYGESFDVGETFSGVDLDAAFNAVEGLKAMTPPGFSLTQFALRWILMFDAVTCAIPGAKRPQQVADNCTASGLPAIDGDVMRSVRVIYDTYIRDLVHYRW